MSSDQLVTDDTLKQIAAAFNRHDVDAIMEFSRRRLQHGLATGFFTVGTRCVGKAKVREGIVGRFAGFPDVHYGDDHHWVCGNVGVSTWTLTGTTMSGVRVEVHGCDLWEFRNGKVVRKDSYWKIVDRTP